MDDTDCADQHHLVGLAFEREEQAMTLCEGLIIFPAVLGLAWIIATVGAAFWIYIWRGEK